MFLSRLNKWNFFEQSFDLGKPQSLFWHEMAVSDQISASHYARAPTSELFRVYCSLLHFDISLSTAHVSRALLNEMDYVFEHKASERAN